MMAFFLIYLLASFVLIAIFGLIYLGLKTIGLGIFYSIPLFMMGCLVYVLMRKLPERADESRGPYR